MDTDAKEIEYITTKEALDLIFQEGVGRISLPTLISWINDFGIGFKLVGRYKIDKQKLIDFIEREKHGA